jgi:lipoprotein-anchoring transpeptidase ErfK/SrfK
MTKRIVVKLDRQVLLALEGKSAVHEFDCATGADTHATKPGLFTIHRKHRYYRSRKYDAQMNFALFFSRDGKAIHESMAVGPTSYLRYLGVTSLGSHGCVRLASKDAEVIFNWAPVGTQVSVELA